MYSTYQTCMQVTSSSTKGVFNFYIRGASVKNGGCRNIFDSEKVGLRIIFDKQGEGYDIL